MKKGRLQSAMKRLRQRLPSGLSRVVRAVGTAVLTPIRFSLYSGHFRSTLLGRPVDQAGSPLPWYTYPAIAFLECRDFSTARVLEIGAGNSSLWWKRRCRSLICFESDPAWYASLHETKELGDSLCRLDADSELALVQCISLELNRRVAKRFDVIVVDGPFRYASVALATTILDESGMIIVDNAEWPGFRSLDLSGWMRSDFFGHAPGVVLQHCTAIYYRNGCRYFRADQPIPGAES